MVPRSHFSLATSDVFFLRTWLAVLNNMVVALALGTPSSGRPCLLSSYVTRGSPSAPLLHAGATSFEAPDRRPPLSIVMLLPILRAANVYTPAQRLHQPRPCFHLATKRILQLAFVAIVLLRDVPVHLSGRDSPIPFHVAALDAGDLPFPSDFARLYVASLKVDLLPPNSAVPLYAVRTIFGLYAGMLHACPPSSRPPPLACDVHHPPPSSTSFC